MLRVHFHHEDREEFWPDGGMWRIVNGPATRQTYIDASAELMRDPSAFLVAMLRAVVEWPNSCRTVMTADPMNHRAWFGHAGCFLVTGSPEDCTRLGWHQLNPNAQRAANQAADLAIDAWHDSVRAEVEAGMLWRSADA